MTVETIYASNFEDNTQDPLPDNLRQTLLEYLAQDGRDQAKNSKERAERIEEVIQSHKEQVLQIIGQDRYPEFQKWINDQRQSSEASNSELSNTGGLGSNTHTRREQSISFLRSLGINPDLLEALYKETHAQLTAIEIATNTQYDKLEVKKTEALPEATSTQRDWRIFRPPYFGWWRAWGEFLGFTFDRTLHLKPQDGVIGSMNKLTNLEAWDDDYGAGNIITSVGFWYKMPATGAIEIYAELQPDFGDHRLWLKDEWGFSGSNVSQRNWILVRVHSLGILEDWRGDEMSWFGESGNTNGTWNETYLEIGATYWTHSITKAAFPAGSDVFVEVGTDVRNNADCNDVKVISTMDFQWRVRSVWVDLA